ncbi:MAG: hypothetical protein QM757_38285 [Paludibaculum sp.]
MKFIVEALALMTVSTLARPAITVVARPFLSHPAESSAVLAAAVLGAIERNALSGGYGALASRHRQTPRAAIG